jgi:heptosyltransferase-2
VKKLLLVREDHLGDLVLTTPLIKALAQAYKVDVIARKSNVSILEGNPNIASIFSIEDIAPLFPHGWFKVGKWIRKGGYDVLVMPHARPKEMVLAARVSGVKTRVLMQAGLIGRLTGNICLRTGLRQTPRHFSDVWLDIARNLNLKAGEPHPQLFLTEQERSQAQKEINARLAPDSLTIGIHPGSAGNTCNLPFDEYAAFADLILKRTDYNIIITGIAKERSRIVQWSTEIISNKRVWVSAGELNIRQLAATIERLFVYVCSGTGPLHIANAVGSRTFSPFCSRVGHSNLYWGNTNGRGHHVNFETEFCSTKKSNCCFKGACDANILFNHFNKLILEAEDPGRIGDHL